MMQDKGCSGFVRHVVDVNFMFICKNLLVKQDSQVIN